MSRHSKNASARGYFTTIEKQKYSQNGTITQRLSKDSQKNFSSCSICLLKAVFPVSCLNGHLFCNQCILESILEQKRLFNSNLDNFNSLNNNIQNDINSKLKVIDDHELEKFKDTQTKLSSSTVLDKIAIDKNKPQFWLPSQTPESSIIPVKPVAKISCPATMEHGISLKKLVKLNFQEIIQGEWGCPCCLKTFINGSKISAIKTCGHVYCSTCLKEFVKNKSCISDGCLVLVKEKDILQIESGSTSFSSSGKVESVIYTPAFQ